MTTTNRPDDVDYCIVHWGDRLSPDLEICGKHLNNDRRCIFMAAGPPNGSLAQALGADIVEPVEGAVARGAIPHDPREYGREGS